jgi:hypothetical protein
MTSVEGQHMASSKLSTGYYTEENGKDSCTCGQWRMFYGHAAEFRGQVVGAVWENLVGHEFVEKFQ